MEAVYVSRDYRSAIPTQIMILQMKEAEDVICAKLKRYTLDMYEEVTLKRGPLNCH